jgi:single-strand DNA-binding protein
MAGWSQTIIVGNVGRDPEMRYSQGGMPICNFTVAVSRKWNDKDTNEKKEETTWYRVSCFRQQAEIANQYITKGKQVMVVGRVKVNAYLDKNNQPAATLELNADSFQLLGSRESGGQGDAGGSGDYSTGEFSDIPF